MAGGGPGQRVDGSSRVLVGVVGVVEVVVVAANYLPERIPKLWSGGRERGSVDGARETGWRREGQKGEMLGRGAGRPRADGARMCIQQPVLGFGFWLGTSGIGWMMRDVSTLQHGHGHRHGQTGYQPCRIAPRRGQVRVCVGREGKGRETGRDELCGQKWQ